MMHVVFTVLIVLVSGLSGCGSSSPGGGEVTSLTASTTCINCHQTVLSAGTGLPIVNEWRLSRHNTDSGAGCADCHEPLPGHPNSCNACHNGPNVSVTDEVVRNPDSAGKCAKCHGPGATAGLGRNHYVLDSLDSLPSSKVSWDNMTSVAYVTTKTRGKCTACHNPHNTVITRQHRDWAESGHGDTRGSAWQHYDFKTRGTSGTSPAVSVKSDCVRCHTTTGYINFVTSGFRNISSWGSPADRGKQSLYCNACHVDASGRSYGYARRAVSPVTGYYNYSISKMKKLLLSRSFPDLGESNLCMNCHVGRQSGTTLKAIDAYLNDRMTAGTLSFGSYTSFYRNIAFVNPHYLTGGATIYKANGYEFTGQNYVNDSHYQHDRIGVNNTNNTGNSGPCVTCHLKPGRHTFKAFTYDGNGRVATIASPVCANCHDSANPLTAELVNLERDAFNAAMVVFNAMLQNNGFFYAGTHPYFFKSAGNTSSGNAIKLWRNVNNLGAAFNYHLLNHEPGAFVHNRIYVKRLICDSIDWLNNGAVDGDAEAAIMGIATIDSATRATAINYLLGRTGGTRP